MFNWNLMSPKTQNIYNELRKSIRVLRAEHSKLMKNRSRTPDENKKLRQIIKAHNTCEALRKKIWDAHSLVQVLIEK